MKRDGEVADENASLIWEALNPRNILYMLVFIFEGFSGKADL